METDVPVLVKKPKRKIGFSTVSTQPLKIPDTQSLHHFNNTEAGKAWKYVQSINYESYKTKNQKLIHALDVLHDFIRKFTRTEKLLLIATHGITKSKSPGGSYRECLKWMGFLEGFGQKWLKLAFADFRVFLGQKHVF